MKNVQRQKTFNYAVVGESPIAGKGVFAAKDITAATVVGFFEGRPAQRHSKFALTLDDGRMLRITNEFRYLNHSNRANLELVHSSRGIALVATRPVAKGRELCIDYGPDFRAFLRELKNL